MIIRKAKITDSLVLSLLMNESFGWEKTKPSSPLFFSNKNITCLVAENDHGELMGSASLHLLQKINRRMGIIEDVAVFEKFRGKKIGVNLINELIKLSKNQDCYKVILNTKLDNLSYYEKLGFVSKELQMELRL